MMIHQWIRIGFPPKKTPDFMGSSWLSACSAPGLWRRWKPKEDHRVCQHQGDARDGSVTGTTVNGGIPAGRMMFQLFLQIPELERNLVEFGQKWLMIAWNLFDWPKKFRYEPVPGKYQNRSPQGDGSLEGDGSPEGSVPDLRFLLFLSTTAWLILAGVLSYWDVPTHLVLDLLKSWNYQPW